MQETPIPSAFLRFPLSTVSLGQEIRLRARYDLLRLAEYANLLIPLETSGVSPDRQRRTLKVSRRGIQGSSFGAAPRISVSSLARCFLPRSVTSRRSPSRSTHLLRSM